MSNTFRLYYNNLVYYDSIFLSRSNKLYKIITLFIFFSSILHANNPSAGLYQDRVHTNRLNAEERAYLKKKQTLNICTNLDWKPIEFVSEGKAKGISIDILNIILSKIELTPHYVKTSSWNESQRFLKEGKCDILPSAAKTSKREKYALFTKPYLSYDLVIITKKDKHLVPNLDSIVAKPMSRKKALVLSINSKKSIQR